MIVSAALFLIAMVGSTSNAAFVASTGNAGNSFGTGSVALTDNDSSIAMLNLSDVDPGTVHDRCIEVTFTGTLDPQPVALFMANAPTGALAPYLNLTIDIGPDGSAAFSGCTAFTSTTTLFTGTVASFHATHSSFGSGLASWNPTGIAPETRTFRFRVSVQDVAAAQGAAAGFDVTWETQT